MALKNDASRLLDYNGNIITPSKEIFANCERRLKEKKKTIDDFKNEYDLLERQAFETYKYHIYYLKLDEKLLSCVRDWLNMQKSGKDKDGNKLDKRKNYQEKTNAEYIYNTLKDYLGVDDIIITSFMDFNFSQAYEIGFTSHGQTWELSIPILSHIRIEQYRNSGERVFQLVLRHQDSPHMMSWVGATFEEEELKNIMQKGVEKWCTTE